VTQPAQVTAVLAPSALEVRELVAELVRAVVGPAADPFAVVRLDALSTPPEALQLHLTGFSLLAEQRVIVVSQASDWTTAQQREVLAMLRSLPSSTFVVLTVAGEQATSRTPLLADLMDFIERHGQVLRRVAPVAWKMRPWVEERAKGLGVTIAGEATEELLERVGSDQDRVASELEKLATYVGAGGRIGLAAVRALVTPTAEGSVFALTDALADGKTDVAVRLVREFLPPTNAEDAAVHFLYVLARHLRLLWQAKVLVSAGYDPGKLHEVPEEFVGKFPADPNIVVAVSGKDWLARKLVNQARRHSEVEIITALSRVYVADLTLKGQVERRLPAEAVAELLVAELFAPRAAMGRDRG
ncbi:MAG: DNA polymerase III subunit delta, partial [Armatimonadetes bacterium]|nr:DNA polymerase III subunit delta [Armatimonadota bacterium]